MLTIRGRLITPFYSGVHVCLSENSDSSYVYGFMRLIYGLGAMNTTTFKKYLTAEILLARIRVGLKMQPFSFK